MDKQFQSTHPMRGATPPLTISIHRASDFNPRTPCGVRPVFEPLVKCISDFNPRTPCGVRHGNLIFAHRSSRNFNPRTPCGVRRLSMQPQLRIVHFNPRTPCGVRRFRTVTKSFCFLFQSTHPMRGATTHTCIGVGRQKISIHAPHAGCDNKALSEKADDVISIHAPHAGCDKK